MQTSPRQRANVYFDGFNFYYGCFRNPGRSGWKPYKWLDLSAFISKVYPNYEIGHVRYFTALVNPTLQDPDQRARQEQYIRALETIPNLTVHKGRYATTAKWRPEADPISFRPPFKPVAADPVKMVGIIQEEEKGSDVNLASHLLVDGYSGDYDIAIVVSNDSDLAEPIRLVKSRLGLKVAILNPRKLIAIDLRGIADDYRPVRLGPIQASQFPGKLTDDYGDIIKPESWTIAEQLNE